MKTLRTSILISFGVLLGSILLFAQESDRLEFDFCEIDVALDAEIIDGTCCGLEMTSGFAYNPVRIDFVNRTVTLEISGGVFEVDSYPSAPDIGGVHFPWTIRCDSNEERVQKLSFAPIMCEDSGYFASCEGIEDRRQILLDFTISSKGVSSDGGDTIERE